MAAKLGKALKPVFVMTLVAAIAGFTPLVAASRASAVCAPFAILGSRGSGQQMTDSGGFGQPVADFITRFESGLPAAVAAQVMTWPNDYPARSAVLNAWNAYASWGPYGRSVADGQARLTAQIGSILGSCAGTTKIILAGFSQGAQLTANVYQALPPAQQADIFGMVLFGDPLFNPESQRAVGDFDPGRVGVLAHPASNARAEFPNAGDGRVVSYCHGNDAICQGFFSFRPLACCTGLTGHGSYASTGDAADPTPYTQRAAAYFANRAGYGGAAAAPAARITPVGTAYVNRPFEVSGAQSYDPAGASLTYAWDLANSGTYSAASPSPTRSAVFSSPGTYTIKLRVVDANGLSSEASATVSVVNDPDPGTLGAPTSPTVSLSSDGASENVAWQSPTAVPAARGYAVFTPDGLPLGEITTSTGAASLPIQDLPPQIDVESLDDDGDGGILTLTLPAIPMLDADVDGAPATQNVNSGSEAYSVRFYGTAGQSIYVNGTGGHFDATLSLYDPNGSNIASGRHESSYAGTAESLIDPVNLPLTGGYTLYVVPGAGSTGTLSLQVLTYASVSASVDGASVSYTIGSSLAGRRVAATFAGTAGQSVYVNGTVGNFGAELSLLDPTGALVSTGNAYAYSSGVAQTWITPVNLSRTGTYTLYINPDAAATGTLSLQVLTYASVSASVDGASVSYTIGSSLAGRRVAATFAGTAGQSVYVNGTVGNFGAELSLLDPTGALVSTGNAYAYSSGVAQTWISPVNLSRTGTYTLYINPDAAATGTLSFQILGSYVTASTGVNGIPTTLTIPSSAPGKIMAVTLTASAGSAVSVLGITGAVGGELELYDPDGVRVATGLAIALYPCPEDEDPGTCPQVLIAPVTLPLDGMYTLYFTPDAFDTGSVEIWATGVSGSTSGVTYIKAAVSVDGAAASVTIPSGSNGERVAVTFSGSAGQAVYVNDHTDTSQYDLVDAQVSLVGPSGQVVYTSGGGSTIYSDLTVLDPMGLPQTGTYTLYLVPGRGDHGTFDLQVLSQYVSATVSMDGAAASVTIPPGSRGQRVALTFTGFTGQAVYVNDHSDGHQSNLYDAQVSLVGPSGQVVYSSNGGSTTYADRTVLDLAGLPASGTYTVYLIPGSGDYGTFNLQVLSQYVSALAFVDGAAASVTIPSGSRGQRVAVTFTAYTGQAVYVNDHSDGHQFNLLQAQVSLVGPSGQVAYSSNGMSTVYADRTVLYPTGLPDFGTYTLYLIPASGDYGTFNVQASSYSFGSSAIEP